MVNCFFSGFKITLRKRKNRFYKLTLQHGRSKNWLSSDEKSNLDQEKYLEKVQLIINFCCFKI